MRASVIIPVWNGASVLTNCLDALYSNSGSDLLEVICVDNASRDESAALIAGRYPRVHLIPQPVNLGFAGGVNAGIDAAQGDLFVLINQDSIVQPDWLAALVRALETCPQFGIAGCTILNADGTLNHAGAIIRRPDAIGVHLADMGDGKVRRVEYVIGAAFAIRRQTWEKVGWFDESYYPAYFEESDYCYRARHKGIETAYVPEARVIHLASSDEWQTDTVRHAANQHMSRYRFVSKHFDGDEINDFFGAEYEAIEATRYLDQVIGRAIAARATLRHLSDILNCRRNDLGNVLPPAYQRQLQVGFTEVLRRSFSIARRLVQPQSADAGSDLLQAWQSASQHLQALRQQELDLLEQIFFKSASDNQPEPVWNRLFRVLIKRPLSIFSGREHILLSQLHAVHMARMDQMDRLTFLNRYDLNLLETLVDYDGS